MEQDPEKNGLIIESPKLRTRTRNFTEWSTNIFGWALWFVLIRPAIVLFLWFLGFKIVKFQMFYLEGYKNVESFLFGILSVCCIFLIMIGWNRYNYLRFHNSKRRMSSGVTTTEEMAEYYQIPEEKMKEINNARVIDIHFPDIDNIVIETEGKEPVKAHYSPFKSHFSKRVFEEHAEPQGNSSEKNK